MTGKQRDEQVEIKDGLIERGLGRYCNITSDPSCGHELRVLVPEKKYKEILPKILKFLIDMGFKAGDNCGTHVHFDMRGRDVKKCYENIYRLQDVMYKLVRGPDRDWETHVN